MYRLRAGMRGLLILLALVAGGSSFQVWAAMCSVTAGAIPMQNINLRLANISQGTVLYDSPPYTIKYRCQVEPAMDRHYFPSLMISTEINGFINTLNRLGMGMNITIQESGQQPVLLPWGEIKNIGSGKLYIKEFGAEMPPKGDSSTYDRTAMLSVQLFVDNVYPNSAVVMTVPELRALSIYPYKIGGVPGGVRMQPFFIRLMPDNLGRVEIKPAVVNMGHFYTSVESSLSKSASFIVTATQQSGAGVNFTVPLTVEFRPAAGVTLLDDETVKLSNSSGIPNGMKLTIRDEDGKAVIFNKPSPMGNINMTFPPTGNLPKKYTAVVERIPAATIQTGKFSAAMTVVVKYN